MTWNRMWNSVLAGAVIFMTGCSKEGKVSQPIAPISGQVKLNGVPLAGATVTFQPNAKEGGNLPSSFGKTDAEGKYALEVVTNGKLGAVVGEHTVRITHPDDDVPTAGGKDIEDAGNAARKGPRKIPERYSTGGQFKYDVQAGGATDADFELKAP